MAENDDFDLNDENDESPAGLRRAANKSKRLEQEKAALERELAFARAGITGTDDRTRIFMKGYEGDLDPDKIKEVAMSTGFIAGQEQAPAQQEPNPVQQEQQAFAQATAPSAVAPAQASGEASLVEAFQQGGLEAMVNDLRRQGIPIQYDGQ